MTAPTFTMTNRLDTLTTQCATTSFITQHWKRLLLIDWIHCSYYAGYFSRANFTFQSIFTNARICLSYYWILKVNKHTKYTKFTSGCQAYTTYLIYSSPYWRWTCVLTTKPCMVLPRWYKRAGLRTVSVNTCASIWNYQWADDLSANTWYGNTTWIK